MPAIIAEETFAAVDQVSYDNSQWSPRRTEPGQWLLRGLVKCGSCHVGTNCHKMRGRNGTWHRYYYCRNHDPIRAGGSDHRCPERNIRADALDAFVFTEVRQALLRPDVGVQVNAASEVQRYVPTLKVVACRSESRGRPVSQGAGHDGQSRAPYGRRYAMGLRPTLDSPPCPEAGWLSAGPGPVAAKQPGTSARTWLGENRVRRHPTSFWPASRPARSGSAPLNCWTAS